MSRPSFLVIGAQKAGTSSLWGYLRAHPQVFMAEAKELNFFVAEQNWSQGIEWYEAQFADAGDARAVGEASPLYTMFPLFKGVPERIGSVVPDARLVYLVRDPMARLRSHYLHMRAAGEDERPIAEAVHSSFLVPFSCYALQLEQYLEHFSSDQLLVVPSELLRDDRADVVRRILEFLSVDPAQLPVTLDTEFHRSADKRVPGRLEQQVRRTHILHRAARRLPAPARRFLKTAMSGPAAEVDTALSPDVEAQLTRYFAAQLPMVRQLVRRTWPDWDGWGWPAA